MKNTVVFTTKGGAGHKAPQRASAQSKLDSAASRAALRVQSPEGFFKMKIKSGLMAILVLVVLFGSVAITSAVGYWKITTDKIPAKYTTGDAAGEYNPLDIKGSYDFASISDVFDIPLAELGQAFLVADGPSSGAFQVKTLEETWGTSNTAEREVGTDSVRLFVPNNSKRCCLLYFQMSLMCPHVTSSHPSDGILYTICIDKADFSMEGKQICRSKKQRNTIRVRMAIKN